MKKASPLRKILIPIIVVVLAVGFYIGWKNMEKEPPVQFRTAKIAKREIVRTIDATGTVEPEDLVDVGARVSGEIVSFGKDTSGKEVDYGSEVREGDILAMIDDEIPKATLLQAQAALAKAKANLVSSEAKLKKAERDWKRAERLGGTEALSQSSYDTYLSDWESAKADVDVSKAEVAQADAAKISAERDVQYCIIRAPVDGVVIDRKVNIGQTVVSNMSASSLFLIAKDLKRMEVWASVNEADIGEIRPGMKVRFTVDAFPDEQFEGVVGKIRLNATMTQNVVTYIVEVVTDNTSGRLLPYLTANLNFELENSGKVMAAPSSALRYTPTENLIDKGVPAEALLEGPKVWLPTEQNTLRPVAVKTGLTDGEWTAIKGDLTPGALVVTGVQQITSASGQKASANPFTPTPPRRAKRSTGGTPSR